MSVFKKNVMFSLRLKCVIINAYFFGNKIEMCYN